MCRVVGQACRRVVGWKDLTPFISIRRLCSTNWISPGIRLNKIFGEVLIISGLNSNYNAFIPSITSYPNGSTHVLMIQASTAE